LAADVREENERALASLKHDLEATKKSNAEDKMRKRYQKVRFIGIPDPLAHLISERKKAMRKLKQAERSYQQDPTQDNKAGVEKSELDLYYTLHYPVMEKYIALYPQTPIENEEVLEKRERIRNQLREEMVHGKQKSSGSNAVGLGKRKVVAAKEEEEMSDEQGTDEDELDDEEESEEDEFLDLRHKKR
jgi:rRNA-processing protein Efg1